MEKRSIFRQESLDRVLSPDHLDEYIKVSNPGIWLVLVALLVLCASVLVWGFTGTLPKTLTVNGVMEENGQAICFVDVNALDKDIMGCKVQVSGTGNGPYSGLVSDVSTVPYSAAEIATKYESDWVTQKLVTGEYSYAVTVDISGNPEYTDGAVASITIITEEVKPVSWLLN
ncbi:MAG: hypothetical protein LBK04_03095 [Clostridiales Family XIII bacterium]|jgi:hypothetical protein|nr:hypothetical protein [Clostridiales Family XIII bacterium]